MYIICNNLIINLKNVISWDNVKMKRNEKTIITIFKILILYVIMLTIISKNGFTKWMFMRWKG